jgi:hypothetical protein
MRPGLLRSPAVAARAAGTTLLFLLASGVRGENVYLTGDAHTDSAAATTPAGSAISLRVSPASATFLRFDLSALPTGMTVESATLTVRPLRVLAPGTVGAHVVTGDWNEDTLTHERRPATDETPVALQIVTEESASGNDLTFGVTSAVAAWLSGAPNRGIALIGDGVVDLDVASKENQAVGQKPRLEIVLVSTPPPGP